MSAKKRAPKKRAAKKKAAKGRATKAGGFTAEERAAMRERAKELKAQKTRAEGEKALLEKVAEMPKSDRVMGERLHEIVTENAPDLAPRTWYGMPAWANADGKVVCYFQSADKFKSRYATFGFNDAANIDDGTMWVTSFGLTELTGADEKKIAKLVRKAVS